MKLKKIALTIGISVVALSAVGCDSLTFDKGDLIYANRFEVVQDLEYVYEVRDRETGIHYLNDFANDSFCPLYNEDGSVKRTKVNDKYVTQEAQDNEKAED